jgi:hypothetical protein
VGLDDPQQHGGQMPNVCKIRVPSGPHVVGKAEVQIHRVDERLFRRQVTQPPRGISTRLDKAAIR